MERVKRRVHEILQIPSAHDDRVGRAFDAFIIVLILLNTGAVIVESMPGVLEDVDEWFLAFEWISVVIFGAEYVLRLWSAPIEPQFADPVKGRLRWMATPFAIIDLLAILPALVFAVDLRFLRVLRVLRVLKITRYAESARILGSVLRRSAADLVTSLLLVLLALLLMSSFMYHAEHEAQPEAFSSIPAAMWWGIVTLTTTGYGDMVPITTVGKVVAAFTVLVGVAAIALPIGILSSSFVQEVEARRRGDQPAETACPHCGKDIKQGRA